MGLEPGEGAVPLHRKCLNFSFEMARFRAYWWHFCQEMLAGYSEYNTMFAGQTGVLKRK